MDSAVRIMVLYMLRMRGCVHRRLMGVVSHIFIVFILIWNGMYCTWRSVLVMSGRVSVVNIDEMRRRGLDLSELKDRPSQRELRGDTLIFGCLCGQHCEEHFTVAISLVFVCGKDVTKGRRVGMVEGV